MATHAPPPIAPVEIIHSVDVIPADDQGNHGESYNYLDYLFVGDGLTARARSYLDTIETVVLHGPARAPNGVERVVGTAFEEGVLAYLKLRYRRIERLNPAIQTGRPYDILWQEGDGAA